MFDNRSKRNLEKLHPLLQQIFNEAINIYPFIITDSQRGKVEQEIAFRKGNSKVRFGDSAHNWKPSIAADIWPSPFNINEPVSSFVKLQLSVILPIAHKLKIPIRQGIDFNRNGVLTDDRWDDLPHIELYPWREWASKCKPFYG